MQLTVQALGDHFSVFQTAFLKFLALYHFHLQYWFFHSRIQQNISHNNDIYFDSCNMQHLVVFDIGVSHNSIKLEGWKRAAKNNNIFQLILHTTKLYKSKHRGRYMKGMYNQMLSSGSNWKIATRYWRQSNRLKRIRIYCATRLGFSNLHYLQRKMTEIWDYSI